MEKVNSRYQFNPPHTNCHSDCIWLCEQDSERLWSGDDLKIKSFPLKIFWQERMCRMVVRNSPVRWQESLKRLCPHLLVQECILLGWFFHNLQMERHSDAISIKSVNAMATAMREMCQGVEVTWIRPGVYWLILIVHTFIIRKKMKKLAIIKWTLYFTI
jgi:hypothetical protein